MLDALQSKVTVSQHFHSGVIDAVLIKILLYKHREQRGTGQIRRKVKEDEIRIGIAGPRSLSSKAGEGVG